jgi:hypothetical protein
LFLSNILLIKARKVEVKLHSNRGLLRGQIEHPEVCNPPQQSAIGFALNDIPAFMSSHVSISSIELPTWPYSSALFYAVAVRIILS